MQCIDHTERQKRLMKIFAFALKCMLTRGYAHFCGSEQIVFDIDYRHSIGIVLLNTKEPVLQPDSNVAFTIAFFECK